MGHQIYVLLCTETTVSNHPVVFPKSSCDVHPLRRPCSSAHKAKSALSAHESSAKNSLKESWLTDQKMCSWCDLYPRLSEQ